MLPFLLNATPLCLTVCVLKNGECVILQLASLLTEALIMCVSIFIDLANDRK